MNISSSRRGFLKGLAGASAFAIGGCKCPFGSQKIRLAAVGVMGKGFSDWTPMLKTGLVEMVAFCDADYTMREKAQQKLAQIGIDFDMYRVPFYTDYRKLLDDAGVLGIDAFIKQFFFNGHDDFAGIVRPQFFADQSGSIEVDGLIDVCHHTQ